MRSRIDEINSILPNAYERGVDAAEFDRLAREYRAVLIGEMIADAILWCVRLPQRLRRGRRYARRVRQLSRPEFSPP